MEDLKKLAAMTALNKLMRDGHFSICTLDSVAKMMNVVTGGESYAILRSIHCVDYADMPQELREAIPQLISDVLGDPAFQFGVQPGGKPVQDPAPRKGFLNIIGIE